MFVPNELKALQFYLTGNGCSKLRQQQSEPGAHGGAAENRKAIPKATAVSEASLRLVLFANCRLSTHK